MLLEKKHKMLLKMTVFWGVAPCNLVENDRVSEVLTVSIIRATVIFILAALRS
jgi:hypothetical protein